MRKRILYFERINKKRYFFGRNETNRREMLEIIG